SASGACRSFGRARLLAHPNRTVMQGNEQAEFSEQGMTGETKTHYEVIVVGAGVAGIYQIKRLVDLGIDATVLDSAPDLGGTWYWNRYPGCRFDSESYTYGFSFSKE